MQKVRVPREQLLEKLRENKVQHKWDYEEALTARRTKIQERLQSELERLSNSESYQTEQTLYFPVPPCHEKEYIRAIEMVAMSVDDTIELTAAEFDNYVLDNWPWKDGFRAASSVYGVTK